MDVPDDEDGLIKDIIDRFTELKKHYAELDERYKDHKYPDQPLVTTAIGLIHDVLSQQKDNEALVTRLLTKQDALDGSKDDMAAVEAFFSTQVDTFDNAVRFEEDLRNDIDYIAKDETADKALNTIRLICMLPINGRYNYKRIPELNALMDTVRASHDQMLEVKRSEILEVVRQCMADIHEKSTPGADFGLKNAIQKADEYYIQRKQKIAETASLALLDGMMPPMWTYKDDTLRHIEGLNRPVPPKPNPQNDPPKPKKMIKSIYRQSIFPAKRLETEDEINAYVEQMRKQLVAYLKGSDGIELK